ncbi:DUF1127 domain-containing protein [Inquilinus sp. Marseille-Q2685]|uniref:DUF1127 domain-containing protein n=1 Tax=Inquilinus sp. Marseille-Q2685 TaxID=2866581 RepID=UPI001CE42D93|nr:DUF1127 domain-containing protein [Inquilinus sp. Marseille-Q2685]
MNDILGSAQHRATWPGTTVGPAETSRRPAGLAALRSLIATWRERIRLRRKLAEMAKANPYLIDDIGLTKRQVEAEIAKPFWQD